MDVRASAQSTNTHPQRGRPTFVPWLGYEDQFLLEQIDEAKLPLTAKSRLQDATNGQIALLARHRGMGLALAPENWRNQRPPGDHHRPANFEQLPYALRTAFSPNHDRLEGATLRDYSVATIDSQIDRQATLIATPGHAVDDAQALGRTTDLRLAEVAAAYFYEQRLHEPAPDDEHALSRVLYATVMVSAKQLTNNVIWSLIRSYGSLRVDGYWIWVNDLQFNSSQTQKISRLCFGLEAETDRPVLLSGASRLHLAFLSAGLAATSIGPGEAQKFVYPPARPPALNERGGRPRRLPTLHQRTLYSFQSRREGKWAERARSAFEAYECSCGHHEPSRPPENNTETKRHTTAINLREVKELSAAPDRSRWLDRRLRDADSARAWLELKPLERGWRTVQPVADEIAAAGNVRGALGF